MKRIARLLRENWNGIRYDYRSWRDGDFTFREFVVGRRTDRQWDPLAPHALSLMAQRLRDDPDRPVFKANPDHLFRFEERWERPDLNPFPPISILPRRKR